MAGRRLLRAGQVAAGGMAYFCDSAATASESTEELDWSWMREEDAEWHLRGREKEKVFFFYSIPGLSLLLQLIIVLFCFINLYVCQFSLKASLVPAAPETWLSKTNRKAFLAQ